MDREKIIQLAHESWLDVYGLGKDYTKFADALERFAALVASHEREECAKIAKQWDSNHPNTNYGGCIAYLIRSRE